MTKAQILKQLTDAGIETSQVNPVALRYNSHKGVWESMKNYPKIKIVNNTVEVVVTDKYGECDIDATNDLMDLVKDALASSATWDPYTRVYKVPACRMWEVCSF